MAELPLDHTQVRVWVKQTGRVASAVPRSGRLEGTEEKAGLEVQRLQEEAADRGWKAKAGRPWSEGICSSDKVQRVAMARGRGRRVRRSWV